MHIFLNSLMYHRGNRSAALQTMTVATVLIMCLWLVVPMATHSTPLKRNSPSTLSSSCGASHEEGEGDSSNSCKHQIGTTSTMASSHQKSVQELSVTDIKAELSTKYDITDTSDCLEKSDLVKRLEDSRAAQAEVVTGPFTYGELLRIGNRVNPTGIVTLSHGLGDTARGWEDVANDLAAQHRHLLFLLPTAPQLPVTINMGHVMNAWYDIKSLSAAAADSDPNLLLTSNYVTTLARQVANKYRIPTNRIVFGGFSQGGALSIASALTAPYRPAGLLILSGYFAAADLVIPKITNRGDLPILMCHGLSDNVLPIKIAEMSKAKLMELGYNHLDFQTFPMAHSAHPRELQLVSQFLAKVLP